MQRAVAHCPKAEVLWLMGAKSKWLAVSRHQPLLLCFAVDVVLFLFIFDIIMITVVAIFLFSPPLFSFLFFLRYMLSFLIFLLKNCLSCSDQHPRTCLICVVLWLCDMCAHGCIHIYM